MVLLCLAAAVLAGLAVAVLGPIAFVLVAAVPIGLLVLRDVRYVLWASLGVITLLPFATLPVDIGVTPTFLEVTLAGTAALALVRQVYLHRTTFVVTPIGVALALFIGLMGASFILGVAHARPTVTALRRFADLVLALAFFYVFVNVLEGQLIRQTFRMLLLLGGVAAALGVVLYVAPTHLSEASSCAHSRLPHSGGCATSRPRIRSARYRHLGGLTCLGDVGIKVGGASCSWPHPGETGYCPGHGAIGLHFHYSRGRCSRPGCGPVC